MCICIYSAEWITAISTLLIFVATMALVIVGWKQLPKVGKEASKLNFDQQREAQEHYKFQKKYQLAEEVLLAATKTRAIPARVRNPFSSQKEYDDAKENATNRNITNPNIQAIIFSMRFKEVEHLRFELKELEAKFCLAFECSNEAFRDIYQGIHHLNTDILMANTPFYSEDYNTQGHQKRVEKIWGVLKSEEGEEEKYPVEPLIEQGIKKLHKICAPTIQTLNS